MSAQVESSPRKRVLFVCTHNEVRSLTAEHVYRSRQDLEVRSAGMASHAKNPVTMDEVKWADLVVVFEPKHAKSIVTQFSERDKRTNVVCLGLPDKFEYKSPKLVIKLVQRLRPYLGEPSSIEKKPKSREPSLFQRFIQGNLF